MRVAIIGYGQLARMLALSGLPLGLEFSFYVDQGEPADTRCVDGLGEIVFAKPELLGESLYQALHAPHVVTFEKEQVDLAPIKTLAPFTEIDPSLKAVEVCQHRHKEKQLLDTLGIANARHTYADNRAAFDEALQQAALPVVIKSVCDGYDGKNQWVVKSLEQPVNVPDKIIQSGVIIEQWIPFQREISLVGARGKNGEIRCYSPTENQHHQGILIKSIAPAPNLNDAQIKQAQGYLEKIMISLDYVGVLAMECFVTESEILVNELAPRVHNSGHWTQNGAVTSQFENHLRATTGLPLGETNCHGVAGMLNVLGPNESPLAMIGSDSTLHWYNKTIRPGRKLGHVNFTGSDRAALEKSMSTLQAKLVQS